LSWLLHRRRLRKKPVSWRERRLPPDQQSRLLSPREYFALMYGRPPLSSRASPRQRRPLGDES
jgi:hypothetical protein